MDDGSCEVAGCMDPSAPNYKPFATFEDKTCAVYFVGCTDPAADNWRRIATVDDGSCFTTGPPPTAPPPPIAPPHAPCTVELSWALTASGDDAFFLEASPWPNL